MGAPARLEIDVGAEEIRRGRKVVSKRKKEYILVGQVVSRFEM